MSAADRRRLVVMRHAKSSWKSQAPDDHSRPLNKRGRRDAPAVALELDRMGWLPDLVISSDSERTRQTVRKMVEVLDDELAVQFTRDFYHAGIDEIDDHLAAVARATRTVLVLGHNPGWDQAASVLCGQPIELKTANAALLVGPAADWAEALADRGSWRLEGIIVARELAKD